MTIVYAVLNIRFVQALKSLAFLNEMSGLLFEIKDNQVINSKTIRPTL